MIPLTARLVAQLPNEPKMGVGVYRDNDLTRPLVLHVVEGVLGEVESIMRKLAVAEADLTRLNTRVTTLEAEIAELRNQRALPGEENPSLMRLLPAWLRLSPARLRPSPDWARRR